jgi:hypothetical protein
MVWGKSGYIDPSLRKVKRQFVKGPIPLHWLCRASQLPGKALHVGLMLWYLAGVNQSKEVLLSNSRLSGWGITRYQKSRGLSALERAGLVKVKRGAGRNPRVLILEAPLHD